MLLMENMQDLETVINIPVYYYELFQGYRGKMGSYDSVFYPLIDAMKIMQLHIT